jgi:hypothetical protein
MPKAVAILGNASRTREFAPFDDLAVDVWVMSIHAWKARRCNAVLEMHPDVLTGERWDAYPDTPQYREWLRDVKDIPIYMHQVHPEIPLSITYPRHQIEARFMHNFWKGERELKTLFGGSASYAVALAIHLGYERIELYGIELAKEQYQEERNLVFWWMGKASTLGIDVVISEQSLLVREILYPYEVIL